MHARAYLGILLGVEDHGIYQVMRLSDRKVERSVHVTFDEKSFPGLSNEASSSRGEAPDEWGSSYPDNSRHSPSLSSEDEEICPPGGSSDEEIGVSRLPKRSKK